MSLKPGVSSPSNHGKILVLTRFLAEYAADHNWLAISVNEILYTTDGPPESQKCAFLGVSSWFQQQDLYSVFCFLIV